LIILFFFAPSNGSQSEPFLFYGCARHSFILVSFFAPFSSQLCCAIVFDFTALKRAVNCFGIENSFHVLPALKTRFKRL
jgi:hypothetical protein